MKIQEIKEISPITLAFLGDAYFTFYIRNKIISNNAKQTANFMHKTANSFCNAKTQSLLLDKLLEYLDEEELDLVRRTRNHKTHKAPQSASIEEYKKATCFEALIGYWHLLGEEERIEEMLEIILEDKLC